MTFQRIYKVDTVLFPDDTNILIKAKSNDMLNQ